MNQRAIGSSESDFPRWAPSDVVARWRAEAHAAGVRVRAFEEWAARSSIGNAERAGVDADVSARRRELHEAAWRIPQLLERLLRDAGMRPTWELLVRAGDYRGCAGARYTLIFLSHVLRAYRGPLAEEAWTPARRVEWAREVKELCAELAVRLEATAANGFLQNRFASEMLGEHLRMAGTSGAGARFAFDWRPGPVSDLLRSIGGRAETLLARSRLDRPGDRLAERTYFVRRLGEFFAASGIPDWTVRMIHAATVAAFNDQALEPRVVYRNLEGHVALPRGAACAKTSN